MQYYYYDDDDGSPKIVVLTCVIKWEVIEEGLKGAHLTPPPIADRYSSLGMLNLSLAKHLFL